jgi:hypothetical protein
MCFCPVFPVFTAVQPEGVKVPKQHIEQRGKFSAAKWAAAQHLVAQPVAAVHFTSKAGH